MPRPRIHYSAFDVVPSPKGASTHITWFVRGLVEAGVEVDLVTVQNEHLPEASEYAGASVYRIGRGSADTFLGRALEYGDRVAQRLERAGSGAYALCHFRNAWCGLPIIQAAQRLGYRTLYEVNGLPSVELKYHYPALRGSATLERIRQREILTLLQADALICPSEVTAAYLRSLGVEAERLRVIPNGVAPELFQASPLPSWQAPFRLVYVGTLADWQGLPVLLRALALVRQQLPVRLYLVGSGRERQKRRLLRLAEKLGLGGAVFIEQPQEHERIPAWLASAHVCVAPLGYNDRNVTQGCCPLKVLEYMAAARPIVAANLPVVRELVRDGVDALLFEPDDAQDLARQLLRLLGDPATCASLAAAAQRRAARDFPWRSAQQQLLSLYDELLGTSLTAAPSRSTSVEQPLEQRDVRAPLTE